MKSIGIWKSHKGFTLIEVMASLLIGSIICSIVCTFLPKSFREVKMIYEDVITNEDIEKGVSELKEILIRYNNISFSKEGEELLMRFSLGREERLDKIFLSGNTLKIKYCSNIGGTIKVSENIILKQVENFKVYQKGRLIYLEIETLGKKHYVCT